MIFLSLQIIALLSTFVITIILANIVIPILRKLKLGQVVRDDGPQTHLKKQGTPIMGGLIMFIAIIIVSIFGFIKYPNIIVLLIATLGFGVVGFLDDFIKLVLKNPVGLKPRFKMLGLLIVASVYVMYMLYGLNIGTETFVPFLNISIELPILIYIPFAIFVMLATTNSLNLTDGLDGLATTVTAIIMTFFTVLGLLLHMEDVVFLSSMVTGTCLGFLLFNLHPAKVFMGDTGALALGGAISAVALYLKVPFVIIIVAGVCVLEAISVMIQVLYFKKTGKRVFKMAPLHHHFELSGWKETKVVAFFSVITLILCVIGVFAIYP